VKHIVERHRGRLDISSKRGIGTTVTVRLPLYTE
jgi:two-component system, OmpR family, phosphate regulon sensor histidine kinase PhoR